MLQVFLDVSVGGQPAGRIVLGLFGSDVPKTAANFAALGRSLCFCCSGVCYSMRQQRTVCYSTRQRTVPRKVTAEAAGLAWAVSWVLLPQLAVVLVCHCA